MAVHLTAHGISLPATQNASADANTLDDYEEGTWTNAVTGADGGNFGVASASDLSAYTKIGRNVLCHGYTSLTSENSYSGYMRHSLPFTAATLTDDADYSFCPVGIPNVGQPMPHSHYFFIQPGAYAYMWKIRDDGTNAYMDAGDVDVSWQVGYNFHMISA